MAHPALAALVAVLTWWLATGLVLLVATRGRRTELAIVMSTLAAIGLIGVERSGHMVGAGGAYLGFGCALLVWAWHEMTFLTGLVTGPERMRCPPGLTGTARFRAAFRTVRDHEAALVLTLAIVAILQAGAENRTALWTFAILWAMRVAAKLTVFFGAPNAVSELMPERMRYLTTYFRTDRTSPLVWGVVATALAGSVALATVAVSGGAEHRTVGAALIGTFLALAALEHVFLVWNCADSALWKWALPARKSRIDDGGLPRPHADRG